MHALPRASAASALGWDSASSSGSRAADAPARRALVQKSCAAASASELAPHWGPLEVQ